MRIAREYTSPNVGLCQGPSCPRQTPPPFPSEIPTHTAAAVSRRSHPPSGRARLAEASPTLPFIRMVERVLWTRHPTSLVRHRKKHVGFSQAGLPPLPKSPGPSIATLSPDKTNKTLKLPPQLNISAGLPPCHPEAPRGIWGREFRSPPPHPLAFFNPADDAGFFPRSIIQAQPFD